MRRFLLTLVTAVALPALALADGVKIYEYDGSFEEAAFGVESAIVGKGLVVDYVSHVGAMLARTKEDVGGTKDLFADANVYLFCSAALSRKMMEADPANIAHCPYAIFVAAPAEGGKVQIGYREMPDGAMKEVEALLDEIAREAVGD